MDEEDPEIRRYLIKTYQVTLAMLLFGQAQFIFLIQFKNIQIFYATNYYIGLIEFYMSFLSVQLYVFFFNNIQSKGICLSVFYNLWTYEANTLCLMILSKPQNYYSMIPAVIYVYIVMVACMKFAVPGNSHYLSRNSLMLWTERIYAVISFGIIVCGEMEGRVFTILMEIVYIVTSHGIVILFATSIRKPDFFRLNSDDWVLFGQLYYLNFYILFTTTEWAIDAVINLF